MGKFDLTSKSTGGQSHIFDNFDLTTPNVKAAGKPVSAQDETKKTTKPDKGESKAKTSAAKTKVQTPKPKSPRSTKNTDETKTRVNMRLGIPAKLQNRLGKISVKSGFGVDQATDMIIKRATDLMNNPDIATMAVEAEPELIDLRATSYLRVSNAALAAFRAEFDPLGVYRTITICRNLYVQAFATALEELEKVRG